MTLHELGASSDEVSLAGLFEGEDPAASGGIRELGDVLSLVVTGGWPQQLQRRDPDRVLRCFRSLARNIATAVGVRTIASDTGLSRDAVTDYMAALERLMVVEDQPAFSVHLRSSRNLRSTPHRHFIDPSLATAALQVDVDGLLKDLNFAGLLLESLGLMAPGARSRSRWVVRT